MTICSKLKKSALKAGKKGVELAGVAKDKAGAAFSDAKDKTSEMIAKAKEQRRIQVIKTPQEHLPAPSPAQDQYDKAILAKEEEILSAVS